MSRYLSALQCYHEMYQTKDCVIYEAIHMRRALGANSICMFQCDLYVSKHSMFSQLRMDISDLLVPYIPLIQNSGYKFTRLVCCCHQLYIYVWIYTYIYTTLYFCSIMPTTYLGRGQWALLSHCMSVYGTLSTRMSPYEMIYRLMVVFLYKWVFFLLFLWGINYKTAK